MRIKRRGDAVTVQLQDVEVQVLTGVLDELDTGLTELEPDDPVWQRLHPQAFADPEAEEDFRSLVGPDLAALRTGRLGLCRQELATSGGRLHLEPEALERWLTVLNDVRLALGTRLDITAEDDGRIDPTDPQAQGRSVYYWLTAVQSNLVDAAMRS